MAPNAGAAGPGPRADEAGEPRPEPGKAPPGVGWGHAPGDGEEDGGGGGVPTPPARREGAGRWYRRRKVVLVTVTVTNFIFNSSFAVLGAVLPDIAQGFQVREATAAWSVIVPMLVAASIQPATGLFADLFGRKRVWLAGYVVNLGASMVCGTARSFGRLIVGRLIQGFGAALDMPTGVGIALSVFERNDRSMVLAAFTVANTAGSSAGLIAGGVITEKFGWRALFLLPILPVALLLVAAVFVLPESGGGKKAGDVLMAFDWMGSVLLVASVLPLLLGVNNASWGGWASPAVYLPVAASLLVGVGFFKWERRRSRLGKSCIIMPALFTAETSATLAANMLRMCTYLGLFQALPLMLRDFYGMPSSSSMLLTPRPFYYGLAALACGKLIKKFDSAKNLLRAFIVVGTVGSIVDKALFVWLASAERGRDLPMLLLQSTLFFQGFFNGFSDCAIKTLMILDTPSEYESNMQGILNASAIIAYMVGIEIAVVVVDEGTELRPYRSAAWTFFGIYAVNFIMVVWVYVRAVTAVKARRPAVTYVELQQAADEEDEEGGALLADAEDGGSMRRVESNRLVI